MKGKAAIVQDAEAYQHLLDIAARADPEEGIRQGRGDAKQGKVRPARQVLRTLKPEMAYLVYLTARTERDLAQPFGEIDAKHSEAALKWNRGLKQAILSLEAQGPLPAQSYSERQSWTIVEFMETSLFLKLNFRTPLLQPHWRSDWYNC